MGKLKRQDGEDLARRMHKQNVIRSERLLAALHDKHGMAKMPAPMIEPPKPLPQKPFPAIPKKVMAEVCAIAFPISRIKAIQKATLKEFDGITIHELMSGRRQARVALARQTAMYLAKKFTSHSFIEIGRRFGRDHSTICHAVDKIEHLVKTNPEYAAKIERITGSLEFADA